MIVASGEGERRATMKTLRATSRVVVLSVAGIFLVASAAQGAEIKVMTSGAFTAAYLELAPEFERITKDKIVTAATSMGTGADSIPSRLQRGEPVDVVIVADSALDELIKDARVVKESRVALARSAIGMAVRAGAPKPDISSVDALKRTLLNAKSIAYSASVSGVYLSTELFQRLGIADKILTKAHRIDGERVGAVVARGEAEIGFQQVSELLPVPGIDYVGPLPPEVQKITVFSAGIVVGAREPDGARALIKFLASASVAPTVAKTGLEPVASH
jgi:molybdate transport system substrate-binding protein